MLGFRRTFRSAGAKTVISSLWRVSDESTNELMQSFYERLWLQGQSKIDALRGAQLEMLKRARIENEGEALPSTWGAFGNSPWQSTMPTTPFGPKSNASQTRRTI